MPTDGLTRQPHVIGNVTEQYRLEDDQLTQRNAQLAADYAYGKGSLSHEVYGVNSQRLAQVGRELTPPSVEVMISDIREDMPRVAPSPSRLVKRRGIRND